MAENKKAQVEYTKAFQKPPSGSYLTPPPGPLLAKARPGKRIDNYSINPRWSQFNTFMMTVSEWVIVIETQINSTEADFTLAEKLAFLVKYYDNDPLIPKRALDIVRSNLARDLQV